MLIDYLFIIFPTESMKPLRARAPGAADPSADAWN
jgi:hypothetical protein